MEVWNATPRHHGRPNDENSTASQSVTSLKGGRVVPPRLAMRTPSQQNLKTNFSSQVKQMKKEGSISETAEPQLKNPEPETQPVKSRHGNMEREYMDSYNYLDDYYQEHGNSMLKQLEMFALPFPVRDSVSDEEPQFGTETISLKEDYNSPQYIAEQVMDDISPCSLSDLEDL